MNGDVTTGLTSSSPFSLGFLKMERRSVRLRRVSRFVEASCDASLHECPLGDLGRWSDHLSVLFLLLGGRDDRLSCFNHRSGALKLYQDRGDVLADELEERGRFLP